MGATAEHGRSNNETPNRRELRILPRRLNKELKEHEQRPR
jgi:hypothetical protein